MIDNGKIKLSIVIPYFETYELTKRLLQSLIMQINMPYIEIILIDDGCNETKFDSYLDFIDGLGFTYKNYIKIIHQENGGVSKARNVGLDLAKGKYVAFIDSDDMIMPNYVDTLLNLIDTRDEEIIYFNWLDINTNEIVRHPNNPAVWKAIYKREILPRFEECYKTREDYFFLDTMKELERTSYYYDKVLYIYNSGREDGLTCKSQRGEL